MRRGDLLVVRRRTGLGTAMMRAAGVSPASRKLHTRRQHHAAFTEGMSSSQPARTAARRIPTILSAGLLVVIAGICAALSYQLLAPSSSTATSPIEVLGSDQLGALGEADGVVPDGTMPPRGDRRGALGEADGLVPDGTMALGSELDRALGQVDGVVPDGTTVFDEEVPGVANVDPDLLAALRQAATDAADDGVEFFVDSGWRSAEYQNQLLREAVFTYGSEEEAARWVATADTSPHVSGDAVDIGPSDAMAWLSEHGATYGLCQIYSNEPWHYELRPEAIDHRCPPMYADPTHDRRMQH